MKNPFLVGQQTYLRPLEPDDAALTAACNNSPDARTTFFTHTPASLAAETRRIQDLARPGNDYIPFVICLREADEAGIGITAYHRVDLVSRAAVFSLCIPDPAHWGKRVGSEATSLMLHYAFETLNLHRVQLHVCAENLAAVKIYEKHGFVREGVLREAMCQRGRYSDFLVMGILEGEWRTKQSPR